MPCKSKKATKYVKKDTALQRKLRQGKITRSEYNKQIKKVQTAWRKEVKEKEMLERLMKKHKKRRKR